MRLISLCVRAIALLSLGPAATGCAVDGLLFAETTREGQARLPDPAPQTLTGQAGLGTQVTLAHGNKVLASQAAGPEGRFSLVLDGAVRVQNGVLDARKGRRQALAIVPLLPEQSSVLHPARTFDLAQLSPGALQIDHATTTLALVATAKLRAAGQGLAAAPPEAVTSLLIEVHTALLAGKAPLVALGQMVARLDQAAAQPAGVATASADQTLPPFDLSAKGSLLSLAHLQAAPVDYDGDGAADLGTAAFDKALAAAVASLDAGACFEFDPARIRVVLMARLSKTAKNGNCEAVNTFLWAKDKPESQVFLTGGVHKEAPVCSAAQASGCLDAKAIDATNAVLGNWTPNKIAMRDDGTGGDALAGDGIWSIALDLPYWTPVDGSPGMRIAYKFTLGTQGQGWTGSEEFPGNQRILELVDVNGDHLITRLDDFADQTTNKDKANQLAPANDGCGENKWLQVSKKGCASDTREREVDLNGDCTRDGWPATSATPLTVKCLK